MFSDHIVLYTTAALLGVTHTLLGPDHYIPFIALGKARRWSLKRTMAITTLSGIGHVFSSIVIGLLLVFLGKEFLNFEAIEKFRAPLAGWLLFGFGVAYTLYGVRHAWLRRNQADSEASSSASWLIFIVFALGPCEPLIPLLMTPAATISTSTLIAVCIIFSLFTVTTMCATVVVGCKSIDLLPNLRLSHLAHAFAGGAITSCAVGMLFLGL
ncbi:MAG: hypothetical protein IPP40_12840 [bacterium]|nr:hypothetical protein [bacterium]